MLAKSELKKLKQHPSPYNRQAYYTHIGVDNDLDWIYDESPTVFLSSLSKSHTKLKGKRLLLVFEKLIVFSNNVNTYNQGGLLNWYLPKCADRHNLVKSIKTLSRAQRSIYLLQAKNVYVRTIITKSLQRKKKREGV